MFIFTLIRSTPPPFLSTNYVLGTVAVTQFTETQRVQYKSKVPKESKFEMVREMIFKILIFKYGSSLLSQHCGRLRQVDCVSSRVQDQPEQHDKTPSLQKYKN